MAGGKQPTRRYSSDRRRQQAEQTRSDVLDAAVCVFRAQGWSATTLNAIAAEAGVAVDTVYNGFKSKKNLLREAFDVSLVGDDAPVPLAERPEYRAMGAGERADRIRAGARLNRIVLERSARLFRALRDAASADAEVAGWCRELERARRQQHRDSLQLILGRQVDGRTLDLVWTLLSPEVYLKLIEERRWSSKAYEEWISRGVLALLDGLGEAG